ncbi:hypothetical protein [Mucilaginibacter sp.]|jgi:hypothetical protein|uniref:hypothetical protein n=1 Tax=Mucilaginibacter sp. TaxID=1882438 RepID=UPI00356AFFD7
MTQISYSKNALACFMASVIGLIVSLRIGKRFIPQIPYLVLIGLVILALLVTIVLITIRKRKGSLSPATTFAFWNAMLRYFIAMDMVMFGLQKIFHLQFAIPLGVLDNPFSSLDGEQLVWAFFGKYYAFTVIIASVQIISAVMLLFKRTSLLAVIVLLPILFNILLLDWFYNLGLVVNIYITLLTIAAVYLLLLDYGRLKEFFLTTGSLPANLENGLKKNALRLSAVFIPVILMAAYKFPATHPEIYGKYEVKSNPLQKQGAYGDSVLTKVFIDNADFVMEYGNYQKRWIGSYEYNNLSKQFKVTWRYPANLHDTLYATIQRGAGPGFKIVSGRMANKDIRIDIRKEN